MGIRQKLIGVVAIFLVPIVYSGEIVFIILFGTNSLFLILILTIVMVVYLYWLFDTVPYGPQQIKEVRIPTADRKTVELLKTTNRRGALIHVNLLRIFEDGESHTRSAIRESLKDRGINLSQPRVDWYVKKLEQIGLLSSPSISQYDKPYGLTNEGKNDLWLAQTYFPKTNLFFLWHHYIGMKSKAKKDFAGKR